MTQQIKFSYFADTQQRIAYFAKMLELARIAAPDQHEILYETRAEAEKGLSQGLHLYKASSGLFCPYLYLFQSEPLKYRNRTCGLTVIKSYYLTTSILFSVV